MQPDPHMLEALLSQNDAILWASMRSIAKQKGLSLPEAPPSPSEMQRLRSFLSKADKIDPREAKRMIEAFKSGRKGGGFS